MARPGRKTKPSRLKALAGNPGKRPANKREPKPRTTTKIPKAPDHLDVGARREWKRLSAQLVGCGLLTDLDRDVLSMYCTAFSRWVAAERTVQRKGTVLLTAKGYPIVSPYLSIANKAFEQMRALLSELGLSPAARSSIKVDAENDDPKEARFFGGPRSA